MVAYFCNQALRLPKHPNGWSENHEYIDLLEEMQLMQEPYPLRRALLALRRGYLQHETDELRVLLHVLLERPCAHNGTPKPVG